MHATKAPKLRTPAPLAKPALGSSVRLRLLVEEQHRHEIADRLRRLRDDSTETNRSIADYVGVGERTVAGWLSPTNPAGISYKNAKKVAELFKADIDWLWRGREKADTPDLMAELNGTEPPWATVLSEKLDALARDVATLLQYVGQREAEQAADALPRPGTGEALDQGDGVEPASGS